MQNFLNIKSIGELLKYSFNIPSYQRGYRWQVKYQVKPLLEDIWSYEIDYANPEAFYCLQPVVVKKVSENLYELIDGQQRLTTILLILHYFNQTEFKTPKKHYSLHFETRLAQEDFLEIVENKEATAENIDLFHLYSAYQFISTWFEEKEEANPAIKSNFYDKLINKTKVIWYEINDSSSVIDIFTRLNIGKIPLTNAELVKALFLSKVFAKEDKYLKQLNIASEWDRIEQSLQKPEFWYFICTTPDKYDTRIEYIFDLMKNKPVDAETYYTFYRFYEEFDGRKNSIKTIDNIWLSIKEYFLSFEEWFQDRELYHLIGYLTSVSKNVQTIHELSRQTSKLKFKEKLRTIARETITKAITELNFEDNKRDVKNALLLFNVLTIINNKKSSIRFPFNHYHNQRWDIEHIRSQTSKEITGKDKENWANTCLQYFSGVLYDGSNETDILAHCDTLSETEKEYCHRLLKILKKEDDVQFDALYADLTLYFGENDDLEDIDNLSNLTLLDETTNRMYKNAFFPVKRSHIINKEKQGVFIPLCTKNVFLKAYSRKLGEVMYWNANDANDYLQEIENTLNK
ncbi:DUF262 domain-containing protein [Lacibacter sediminis]|uniref:DUF262 domain-containing protein n=1 Tax=Lacibacter sediminis TaxID=2760713 RepID=A0A7G5XFP2_9BACT|nr:DUF262 domain-containing protein [Lacibacter sediminis]QNA44295.1 DUF262 domain-containing protein [Lacibacter sediminis]